MQVSMEILNIQCYGVGYLLSPVMMMVLVIVILFVSLGRDLDSVVLKCGCFICTFMLQL